MKKGGRCHFRYSSEGKRELLAAALLLMVFLPTTPAQWDVVWRLALCGIGFGLLQTPNNTAMMTVELIERSGAASGMNATARYVGWSFGSALVALFFGLGGDHGRPFVWSPEWTSL